MEKLCDGRAPPLIGPTVAHL